MMRRKNITAKLVIIMRMMMIMVTMVVRILEARLTLAASILTMNTKRMIRRKLKS